jgi:hypothetical protein
MRCSEIAFTISSARRSKPGDPVGIFRELDKYLFGHQDKDVLKHNSNTLRDFYPNFNLTLRENLDKLQQLILSLEGAQNQMMSSIINYHQNSPLILVQDMSHLSPPLQSVHLTIILEYVRLWMSLTRLSYPRNTSRWQLWIPRQRHHRLSYGATVTRAPALVDLSAVTHTVHLPCPNLLNHP